MKAVILAVRGRAGSLAIFIAAASLWLLSRPFTFVENDAQVYAFLALAKATPKIFSQDIFIKHGSQGQFSIFPSIYGHAISLIGLSNATILLLLFSSFLWIFGCWRLVSAILDRKGAAVALLLLCGMRIIYGGFSTLYVGEGFLTSRLAAEAFVLIALGELARGLWGRGGIAFLVAWMLHPLVVLGGLAVAGFSEVQKRPWILGLAALGGLAVIALAAIGVPPFDRLFTVMDGQWLAATQRRNGFVFVGNWTLSDWSRLFGQAATVLLATLRAEGWRRRFFLATLAAAAAGILGSWIGADGLHIALLVQLQLWRLAWPLAWATLPALVFLAPRSRDPRLWLVPGLLAFALLPVQGPQAIGFTLMGLVGGIVKRPIEIWFSRIILSILIVLFIIYISLVVFLFYITWFEFPRSPYDSVLSSNFLTMLCWMLVPPLIFLAFRFPRVGLAISTGLFIIAIMFWDRRTPWQRYIMQGRAPLAVSGQVLWDSDAAPTWFLLRSPAYVAMQQGSGLLFSSDTTKAWEAHLDGAHGLVPAMTWTGTPSKDTCAGVIHTLSGPNLTRICQSPDGPTTVITDRPVFGQTGTTFDTPVASIVPCSTGKKEQILRFHRFYVYDCHRQSP